MWKRTVGIGCAALALLAALPAWSATPINFDELGFFESLNTQYQAQGVLFGPELGTWTVVAPGDPRFPAPSPENVAAVFGDSGEIRFTTPVAGVSAHFVTGGAPVYVTAFGEAGEVLDERVVTSPSGDWVLYSVTPSGARIASLVVQGTPGLWGLDDLMIDPGLPPVTAASVAGTPGSSGWYRSAVTVTLNAGDPNGDAIESIRYSVDGGPEVAAPGGEVTFAVSSEGEHVIQYYAVDATGMAEAPVTLTLKLDWTAPTLEITSPTATTYPHDAEILVSATASDAVSHLDGAETRLDVDGTPVTSGQTLTGLAPGSHVCTMEARDVAGNTALLRVPFEIAALEPEPTPEPAPTPVTVNGGGLALVNGRPAVLCLWARRSVTGEVAGRLVYIDLFGNFWLRCQPLLDVTRTETGARVAGVGVARSGPRSIKSCEAAFELFQVPAGQDQFVLTLDGEDFPTGQLVHGQFQVK